MKRVLLFIGVLGVTYFNIHAQEITLSHNIGDTIFDYNNNFTCSIGCLLYTSPSPRDKRQSRMPSSA